MTGAAEEFWESRYRERDQVWSGNVNDVLAQVVGELVPGRVLDLGCGEGGDAVWFARQGWTVTAVDVAQVALDRGASHAADAGVTAITWERHDLASSFPGGTFDLVSAQFFQSPIEFPRLDVLRRGADSVAVDGRLLSVSHATGPPWSSHAHDMVFPTPEEELAGLDLDPDAWEVERCEVVGRDATGHDGQTGTLNDGVILVRRRQT